MNKHITATEIFYHTLDEMKYVKGKTYSKYGVMRKMIEDRDFIIESLCDEIDKFCPGYADKLMKKLIKEVK